MSNVDYTKLTQFKDVSALNFAKTASPRLDEKTILQFLRRTSRINARTPYQWSGEPFAGFSTVEPTFQVNGNYQEVNAAQQINDPFSILNYYKKLIALRKIPHIQQSIIDGHLSLVNRKHPDVFAYHHQHDTSLLVISNFRDYTVEFDIPYIIIEVLAHNYLTIEKRGLRLTLRPFESYVFSVES
jgi:glycosidase